MMTIIIIAFIAFLLWLAVLIKCMLKERKYADELKMCIEEVVKRNG